MIQICSEIFACRLVPGQIEINDGREGHRYLTASATRFEIPGRPATTATMIVRDQPRRFMANRLQSGRETVVHARIVSGLLMILAPADAPDLDAEAAPRATEQDRWIHHRRTAMRVERIVHDWTVVDRLAATAPSRLAA